MKTKLWQFLVAICLVPAVNSQALAQGTAFTYQGRLNDSGSPANGRYDFRFRLAADSLGNTYAGSPVLTNGIPVTNGLFATTIDFGSGIFVGSNYWVEVDVRTNGGGGYTSLTPLQALTPTPYALFANTASNLSGTLPAAQLGGTIANGNLPASPNFSGTVTATTFSGSGANLASLNANNLASGTVPLARLSGITSNQLNATTWQLATNLDGGNAATLAGLNPGNFWQLGGNNVPAGQFIGSSNNQSVEFRVNGVRALRLDPNTTGAPNVIAGSPFNQMGPGVKGSTIAGGGATNYFGSAYTNQVDADFSSVLGGADNKIRVGADWSTIGGGTRNIIQTNSYISTIGGGQDNTIDTFAVRTTIGGGRQNTIQGSSHNSTISGGYLNTIQTNSQYITIGGGTENEIQANNYASLIAGGWQNTIQPGGLASTISGGYLNTIQTNAQFASINGGALNTIQSNANFATVGGGYFNAIQINDGYATIGGGNENAIEVNATMATIGGGFANGIQTTAERATISGGSFNTISANATNAAIGGGSFNLIYGNSTGATIPGGTFNTASSHAFAAGNRAHADNPGSFVWADSQDTDFYSSANNQFLIRAAGGVGIGEASPSAALHIVAPTNAPPPGLNPPDNGLLLGLLSTSGYKWIQSYGGALALNPLGNSIGIGKTNPASALDVAGTVIATAFSGDGSGLTGVTPAGGSGNYIQNQSASDQTAGLRINGNGIFNGGKVGIGVTSPQHLLHAGTTLGTGAINGSPNRIVAENSGASGRAAFLVLAGPGAAVSPNRVEVQLEADVSQNRGIFGTTSNHELQMRINNSEVMRLWTNGNVSIGAVTPTNKLHVAGGVSATAFVSTSDRNAKENFSPVSPREVLAKVTALPISTWNFKELHDGRHMGPMAQDFYAAFGLGGSDTTITSVDPDGVALAAIQGLNQKVEAGSRNSEVRIRKLETENSELKQRLEALENIVRNGKFN